MSDVVQYHSTTSNQSKAFTLLDENPEDRVSLAPLPFEDALRGLLETKPSDHKDR